MSATGTRNEEKCRTNVSKDGRYSPKIDKATTERLFRYCKMMDINKNAFVTESVNLRLNEVERKSLEAKSKDELIEMLLRR